MQIQTTYVEQDLKKLYERLVLNMNNKAESYFQIYIDTVVVGKQIANVPVTASSTLYVVSLTALCETAGSNDGTLGLKLRFAGGSANLDVNVLPKNATSTLDPQSSGIFGAPGYQVPSNGTLTITEQAVDYVVSNPAKIRLTVGLRIV